MGPVLKAVQVIHYSMQNFNYSTMVRSWTEDTKKVLFTQDVSLLKGYMNYNTAFSKFFIHAWIR